MTQGDPAEARFESDAEKAIQELGMLRLDDCCARQRFFAATRKRDDDDAGAHRLGAMTPSRRKRSERLPESIRVMRVKIGAWLARASACGSWRESLLPGPRAASPPRRPRLLLRSASS